jgi:integrase
MPRPAKPYLHHDHYVSRAGGEYVKLCHRSEGVARARALLRDHLDRRRQDRERNGGRPLPGLTVSELFVLFLQAVEAEKSAHTFADYQRWCVAFAKQHGRRQARDLTRLDAQKFKQHLLTSTWVRNNQPPRPYKPKTINHAIISLRRAFNWAADNELLPEGRNPFARLKLLPCQGRKRVATQEEYEALLRHCTDDHFRDVLVAMRHTPARPGDIRNLTWAMVQWDRRRWVLSEHKTTRTARVPKPFIIGMNDAVEAVLRERLAKYGRGERVFLNEDGRPWTRNALGLRMRRLRKRAGVKPDERGEEFVLYTNRHSFISRAGMDPTIPEAVRVDMAGHTDGRTTRLYTHIHDEAVAEAGRRVADAMGGQPSTPGR